MVEAVPSTYRGVTPCLIVRDAARALAFYRQAFGATQALRLDAPDGTVAHAEIVNQFYGDRSGTLVDRFGIMWTIATHIEDVPPDDMNRRMAAMGAGA